MDRDEIEKIKAALEPFAISIKDHLPDDQIIDTVAWTAGQHRAACEALELLSAHASRVAELEGALKTIRASAEQSGDWPPRRRDAALEGILKVASKALGRYGEG